MSWDNYVRTPNSLLDVTYVVMSATMGAIIGAKTGSGAAAVATAFAIDALITCVAVPLFHSLSYHFSSGNNAVRATVVFYAVVPSLVRQAAYQVAGLPPLTTPLAAIVLAKIILITQLYLMVSDPDEIWDIITP